MKHLEITWTVTADVYVPDDTDLDTLRKELANLHRPGNRHHPYGSEAQIQKETFEITVSSQTEITGSAYKSLDPVDDYFPF